MSYAASCLKGQFRKSGTKIHLLTDRNGLPLSLGISGANMHDSPALEPLVRGTPPIRSRRGPRRRLPAKLGGCRRLHRRHERKPEHFPGISRW
ncbi:transposase [Streptomyces sp. E5N298]|uniref:transposase n=1 Tax=Streptomyces sp. E5N298 TaxID=1851983 RepID=UPI00237AF22A|nr:transposase [Streptomyces sp. E5N298]